MNKKIDFSTQSKKNRALQKALNYHFPKAMDEDFQFFPDMETLNCYAWIFLYKGRKYELVLNLKTGSVTKIGL